MHFTVKQDKVIFFSINPKNHFFSVNAKNIYTLR